MATTTTTTLQASLPARLVLGFRKSTPRAQIRANSISPIHQSKKVSSIHVNNRFGDVKSSNMGRSMVPVLFANPSKSDIVKEKNEGSETSNAQGPPVLTILAGFIVFFFVAWIVGSTVTWLISLPFIVLPRK